MNIKNITITIASIIGIITLNMCKPHEKTYCTIQYNIVKDIRFECSKKGEYKIITNNNTFYTDSIYAIGDTIPVIYCK